MKKLRDLPLHTHFNIRTGLMIVGLVIALIARASARFSMNTGMWIGLILMAASILWHILFVRCPHCGSHFSLKRALPKYCPWCGKYIDKFH